jgi:hypothetical protein
MATFTDLITPASPCGRSRPGHELRGSTVWAWRRGAALAARADAHAAPLPRRAAIECGRPSRAFTTSSHVTAHRTREPGCLYGVVDDIFKFAVAEEPNGSNRAAGNELEEHGGPVSGEVEDVPSWGGDEVVAGGHASTSTPAGQKLHARLQKVSGPSPEPLCAAALRLARSASGFGRTGPAYATTFDLATDGHRAGDRGW